MYWNIGFAGAESGVSAINRNMRCIEITADRPVPDQARRLIETWDVLKYVTLSIENGTGSWLIETWDVLKSPMAKDAIFAIAD